MSQNAKIGIFDSGLGGLTVLKSIKKILPHESFIYVGDLVHLPYGDKSSESIITYSKKIVSFFIEQQVKLVIIACNSASSVALNILRSLYDIPIIGVIKPSIMQAIKMTQTKSIGVIGTETTVNSKAYKQSLITHVSDYTQYTITSLACPLFVPIVEEGWEQTEVAYNIAKEYLLYFNNTNIDTIILGCTHYPILLTTLQKVCHDLKFNKLYFIDCGDTIAQKIHQTLKKLSLNNKNNTNNDEFYITDASKKFNELGSKFLGYTLPKTKLLSL